MVVSANGAAVKRIFFTLGTKCRLGKRRSAYPTTTLKCDDGASVTRDITIAEIPIEDGHLRHDNLDGSIETFEIEGTVLAREFKPDPGSTGDNLVCSAADKFTATPARPLDS